MSDSNAAAAWTPVDPSQARALADARAQLHHCAQFVSGFGISYLPHARDDSHTSMGWDARRGALVSAPYRGVSLALRLADLTLVVIRDGLPDVELPAHRTSILVLAERLRAALSATGLDAARYSLARHFEIPIHPVADGAAFNSDDHAAFAALAAWYGDAVTVLETVRAERDGSPVRCWPHHFDIATLITIGERRTTGAGLSPGDVYYEEPYFYVNAYPAPSRDALGATLLGGGRWHTFEWIGAVLPGSDVAKDAGSQRAQVREFLRSALDALREASLGARR